MAAVRRTYRILHAGIASLAALILGLAGLRTAGAETVVQKDAMLSSVFKDAALDVGSDKPIILAGSSSYAQGVYYGQGYYQSYYQPYYQPYYQGTYYSQSYYQGYYQTYYQGSYQTTVNPNTTASGNFSVTGVASKGSGTFFIDHPLDPVNKLLFHSFVESPDVKNIYDGVATMNKNGEAIVALPNYFETLNKDFRYQLKPIGAPMPELHVKEEVKNNRFVIGGGVPGGKVSWQVSGSRQDPYIVANPIVPEVEKGPDQLVDKGEYLHPNAYEQKVSGLFAPFTSLFSRLFGSR